MNMRQAMIWTNKPDPGRTEAAETVCHDVLLRVKQDSHNYTFWCQNIANSKFSIPQVIALCQVQQQKSFTATS